MKILKIGQDPIQKKEIRKIRFEAEDMPKVQLFNSSDVICGNPSSNIVVAIVYTWKTDNPPDLVVEFFKRISNYTAMTGFWRTTNGGKYAFANILANPNINKLVVLVFDQDDNGHLLVDSLRNLWKHGINEHGIIINSKAPNPKFEQVSRDAVERLKEQVDLIIVNNIKGIEKTEELIKACYQEPKNAIDVGEIEFYSKHNLNRIYDDGARFDEPYYLDLMEGAKNVRFEEKNLISSLGQSLQAENLEDALEMIAAYIYDNGTGMVDQRKIITLECRSFTITIMNPLEKIPEGFSKEYINKYVKEFLEGKGENLDEFAYTYHERIFKKWGNQVDRAIKVLKKSPNTRRVLISLWDPSSDLENDSAPCLDFLWLVVRNKQLELHAVYRSHHLATVTEDGKLMEGEGAFVPNMFALGTLHKELAQKLNMKQGPLVLTDLSGHLYVNKLG